MSDASKRELFSAAHAALRIAMMQADAMKDSPTVSVEEVSRLNKHVMAAVKRVQDFTLVMIFPTSPPEQSVPSPQ